MKNLKRPIRMKILPPIILFLLTVCPGGCSEAPSIKSEVDHLQGNWEGNGPPGKITVNITGDSLHFFAREDFWYDASIKLPAGKEPKEMHATITNSAPPVKDVGELVVAIFKIEEKVLTLAIGNSPEAPPENFADPMNQYVLTKVGDQ
ncbi:MAG TPA: hypothetical protein PKV71_01000 [Calditrichia bacterium]|nr:hypothetical protein [Calditrichia bacterium]